MTKKRTFPVKNKKRFIMKHEVKIEGEDKDLLVVIEATVEISKDIDPKDGFYKSFAVVEKIHSVRTEMFGKKIELLPFYGKKEIDRIEAFICNNIDL